MQCGGHYNERSSGVSFYLGGSWLRFSGVLFVSDLKWLAEGWTKVAAGTHVWEVVTHGEIWQKSNHGPNGTSLDRDWRTVPTPKKKIDLSKFIGRGVDMVRVVDGADYCLGEQHLIDHDGKVRSGVVGPRFNHWNVIERDAFDPDMLEGFEYKLVIINDDLMMFMLAEITEGWEL